MKKHILSLFADQENNERINCCETTIRTFSIENDDTDNSFVKDISVDKVVTMQEKKYKESTILTETIETSDMDLAESL